MRHALSEILSYAKLFRHRCLFVTLLLSLAVTAWTLPAFAAEKNWDDSAGMMRDGWYLWGMIDTRGRMVLKPEKYSFIGEHHEGLAAVSEEATGKWGYINLDGTIAIAPRFDRAGIFSEGLAVVAIGELFGFIDRQGAIVVEPRFTQLCPLSNGLAAAQSKEDFGLEHFGFVDRHGNWAIRNSEFFWSNGNYFSEGLCAVYLHEHTGTGDVRGYQSKGGYIDSSGKFTIQPSFDFVGDFSEGLAPVARGKAWDPYPNRKFSYIDKTGRHICGFDFHDAHNFSEGLACVQVDNQWGYIDKTGTFVIKPQFTEAGDFSEGLAVVRTANSDGYGYINKNGEIVIRPSFSLARSFSEGRAMVERYATPHYAYIDRTGRVKLKIRDGSIQPFEFKYGHARVAKLIRESQRAP